MTTDLKYVVRELKRGELGAAAKLVGRGMRDNPSDVQIFGIQERERRSRALERFFAPVLLGVYERGMVLGAFRQNLLLGVCGMARPGFCQPTMLETVRVFRSVALCNPVGTVPRAVAQFRDWARRDPRHPHWHLGPVAVDPDMQQKGIGTAMLTAFCAMVDSCSSFAYLETDKSENLTFYQRFAFEVVAEATVLGVPNWFMSRPGRSANAPLQAFAHQMAVEML